VCAQPDTTHPSVPQDRAAEESVLGGVLLSNAAMGDVLARGLVANDFFVPQHSAIFQVMGVLHERGQPIDTVSVPEVLRELGLERRVPRADTVLAALAARVPEAASIGHYTTIVVRKAKARRLAERFERAKALALDDRADEALAVMHACAGSTVRLLSPAERARQLGSEGPRISTGFTTLDRNTRGGMRPRRWAVIGGAPGAGKTTFVTQLALRWAQLGVSVALVAADEDPNGLLIRAGQLLGFDRDLLEEGHEATREALAARLDQIPTLHLIDGDDNGMTVESISSYLASRVTKGQQSALIIDSLQTIRSARSDEARDTRMRIDTVVKALKHAAKHDGHLVIATSELSRGAYRSRDAAERIDDLAAFKESGGVEYGAAVGVVLRSVPDESDLVDATMPKNRLGPEKQGWRMRLDFGKAKFTEVDAPVRESKGDMLKEKILRFVTTSAPPPKSKNAIAKAIGGTKTAVLQAVDELCDPERDGRLAYVGGVFKVIGGSGGSEPVPNQGRTEGWFGGSSPLRGEPPNRTGSGDGAGDVGWDGEGGAA
jgi:replicative DNA helicase